MGNTGFTMGRRSPPWDTAVAHGEVQPAEVPC